MIIATFWRDHTGSSIAIPVEKKRDALTVRRALIKDGWQLVGFKTLPVWAVLEEIEEGDS